MRTENSMRKIHLFFLIFLFLISRQIIPQKADHVVIAEIYGAGGNTGARYKSDYVVLYNPKGSDENLSTWSIQYQSAGATGSFSSKTNLTGTIAANGYYLIQEYTGINGANLPYTPNVTGTISLSATDGKVALVKSQSLITDGLDVNVVDYVGYGNANDYEGSGTAVSPTAVKSICRKDNSGLATYGINGSGWDTDNNKSDFFLNSAPAPLPVELSFFESTITGNKVRLEWRTATEVNNYGFEIERTIASEQGETEEWKRIGFAAGSGNSNSPKEYSFTDMPNGGKEFMYRLKQIDFTGKTEYSNAVKATLAGIADFKLDQNYPNPFNPVSKIGYIIPERTFVRLKVYDLLGREVAELVNENQRAGKYEVAFNGSSLSSGTYFYKLEAGRFAEVKKFVLVK